MFVLMRIVIYLRGLVITRPLKQPVTDLNNCQHEEDDTRIVLHVSHINRPGDSTNGTVWCNDTDVLVIIRTVSYAQIYLQSVDGCWSQKFTK